MNAPRSTFRLRAATPADGERVAAMCAALSAEEGMGATSQFTAAAFRRDGSGPVPAFACLIAEIAGAPMGYALHCQDYDTDRLCRSVYLADLYVEKAARRMGVGRALMAATAAAGRAQGARLMMWSVLRSNEPARRFYAKIGREIDDQLEMVVMRERFVRLAAATTPADGLTLRTAVAADTPLLERLLLALVTEIGEPAKPNAAVALRRDGFGANPAFTAVIAERAGQPAGYALYWPTYDTESASRGGWLSDLYVLPEQRRHGVADRLMAELARRTAAAGGAYLVWLVHANNERARAFYRRLGEEFLPALACVCEGAAFGALAAEAAQSGYKGQSSARG